MLDPPSLYWHVAGSLVCQFANIIWPDNTQVQLAMSDLAVTVGQNLPHPYSHECPPPPHSTPLPV